MAARAPKVAAFETARSGQQGDFFNEIGSFPTFAALGANGRLGP
jgi:hypothetical protein